MRRVLAEGLFAATNAAANSSASKRGRGYACSRALVIQQTAPIGVSVRVLVDRHDLGVSGVRVDEPVASAGTHSVSPLERDAPTPQPRHAAACRGETATLWGASGALSKPTD